MKRTLATMAALALATAASRADWRNFDGMPVPGVSASEWINTGKEKPDAPSLRGKVYILEFFATW